MTYSDTEPTIFEVIGKTIAVIVNSVFSIVVFFVILFIASFIALGVIRIAGTKSTKDPSGCYHPDENQNANDVAICQQYYAESQDGR